MLLDAVKTAAKSLGVLEDDGRLKKLDSLGIVELIMELERMTGVVLPAVSLREEHFESLESVSKLFEDTKKE